MEPLKGRSIEKVLRPRYEIPEKRISVRKILKRKTCRDMMEMSGDAFRGRPARQAGLREHKYLLLLTKS